MRAKKPKRSREELRNELLNRLRNGNPAQLRCVLGCAFFSARHIGVAFTAQTIDEWPILRNLPTWKYAVGYCVITASLPFIALWRVILREPQTTRPE